MCIFLDADVLYLFRRGPYMIPLKRVIYQEKSEGWNLPTRTDKKKVHGEIQIIEIPDRRVISPFHLLRIVSL